MAAAAVVAMMAVSLVPAFGPPPARNLLAQQQISDPPVVCQDLRGGGLVACLHGNDTPPPGVSLFHRPSLEELRVRTTLRSSSPRLRGLAALEQQMQESGPAGSAAVPCIGDGTSGNRVQVL
jgi:hypothetical protein